MTEAAPDARLAIAERLTRDVLAPIKQSLVGKDLVVDLLGVGLVAMENVFLYGPPGTAKSAVVNQLAARIDGRIFDYLLTRFTEPNELFGPFDIARLREGELVTNTEGMLPQAEVVFLDELLNANSAILNALLMALNERRFRRGRESYLLPALLFVAAGNTLPEDDTLGALFDRFLLRVHVENVATDRLGDVVAAGWELAGADVPEPAISSDDLRALQSLTASVDLTQVREAYVELVAAMRRAGLEVSDRRAVRFQRLIAASAILCGRMTAERSDFWVLRATWDRLEQRSVLTTLVDDAIARGDAEPGPQHPQASGDGVDAESLARDLDTLRADLDAADDAARLQVRDRLAAIASRVQWITPGPSRDALDATVAELWRSLA